MKSAKPTPSRGKRGAPAASASAPSAAPRASNSGKDSASRGGAENAEDLPEGWTSAPLDALVEFNPKHPSTLADDTPVSFIPMPAVSETSPVLDVSQTRPLGSVRKGYTHFADGDVLFAKITPCMENGKGAVASALKNGLGCGTTELVVMRSRGAVDPLFLYRFLAQPGIRSAAKDSFTGSAGQARVPASFLKELATPIPPLAEQRRIVAKLEELLGNVEASRQRLAQVPALLKRFRQAVLAAACSGRLTADWRAQRAATVYPFAAESPALAVAEEQAPYGRSVSASAPSAKSAVKNQTPELGSTADDTYNADDLPEGWNWRELHEVLSPSEAFCYGVVQPGADEPDGVPLVRAGDLKAGTVTVAALRKIPTSVHREYQRSQLRGGEILVTVVGAGIGESSIAPASCCGFNIARAVAKLPIREQNATYVHLWLQSAEAIAWMKSAAREVARPTLNLEQLRELPLPLPPLPEQEEIVRRVEAMFAVADRLEARFDNARAQVDRLAPALLAKAFRGELVPQDPRDEPAAALPKRLREVK